jgi:hypothetical protein
MLKITQNGQDKEILFCDRCWDLKEGDLADWEVNKSTKSTSLETPRGGSATTKYSRYGPKDYEALFDKNRQLNAEYAKALGFTLILAVECKAALAAQYHIGTEEDHGTIPICHCTSPNSEGKWCFNSTCTLRGLYYECTDKCSGKENCCNHRLQQEVTRVFNLTYN